MATRKHNYVIGYEGDGQVVYGKDETVRTEDGETVKQAQWANPLTIFQANQMLKKLEDDGRRIYKLVPVGPQGK